MPSDGAQPPGYRPRANDLARSVADDLGPIFRADAAAASPPRRSPVRALKPSGRRRRLPVATLGAVLAAGVAGLSLGGVAAHRNAPAVASVAAGPTGPPIRLAEAPLPNAAALATIPELPAIPPAATHAAEALAVAPRGAAHDVEQAHAVKRHSAHKPRLYTAHVRTCADVGGYEQMWCSHRAVMAADDRLRRAYHSAQRAGVSHPVLASYRNRWADLRHRALSDPDEVVAGYSEMASDLSRMAVTHRRSSPRGGHDWWLFG